MTTAVAPIVGPSAPNSLLKIQKATIKKQLLSAEFSEQLTLEAKPREFTMTGTELVHPDLERCFTQLVPHFCLLTEQLTDGSDYWPTSTSDDLPEQFDGFKVTGIIIGKKNGVTLMGFRTLESGKVLNMTSQYVSFEEQPEEFADADVWHYAHADELSGAVAMALEEVEAALRGKCSDAGRQLDMFNEEQVHEPQVGEIEMGEASQPATKRKASRNTAK
jgi:hypothetical protein